MSSPWTADTRHLEMAPCPQEKEAVDQLIRLKTRKRVEHLRAAMADVLGYLPSDEEMLDRGRSVMAVDARGYPCGVKCFLDMQEIHAPEWASFTVRPLPEGCEPLQGVTIDPPPRVPFPVEAKPLSALRKTQPQKEDEDSRQKYCDAFFPPDGGWDWLGHRQSLNVIDDRELKMVYLSFARAMTLKQIGDECGVTCKRARQLINIALRKIRRASQVLLTPEEEKLPALVREQALRASPPARGACSSGGPARTCAR